jgi:protein-S-isoprenylcysteine O-methyltransferase Ste14
MAADVLVRLARCRVPLGFVVAAVAFWCAQPDGRSLGTGLTVVVIGEALRVWAAGHIEKGREVTRSGPYRFVRHPLYLGSAVMAAGFVVAARSVTVAVLVGTYMFVTYFAAIRTEEARLDARFEGEYSAYREGRAAPVQRAFSLARVRANREYRALTGVAVAMLLLYLRSRM